MRMILPKPFLVCIGKMNKEKDPDMPTPEEKKLSKCDKMVNYPGYRRSLGDFEVCISTATVKGKGRNDTRLSMAPTNLAV